MMKKQKMAAERKEFEAVKSTMTYNKDKMDNMRRQVRTVCCTVLCYARSYFVILQCS